MKCPFRWLGCEKRHRQRSVCRENWGQDAVFTSFPPSERGTRLFRIVTDTRGGRSQKLQAELSVSAKKRQRRARALQVFLRATRSRSACPSPSPCATTFQGLLLASKADLLTCLTRHSPHQDCSARLSRQKGCRGATLRGETSYAPERDADQDAGRVARGCLWMPSTTAIYAHSERASAARECAEDVEDEVEMVSREKEERVEWIL